MDLQRLLTLFVLFPLTACGGMGLTAFGPNAVDVTTTAPSPSDAPTASIDDGTDTGLLDDSEDEDDFVDDEDLDTGTSDMDETITGTTWAVAFEEVRVLSPLGIDFRWNQVDAESLLFHVTGETVSSLAMVSSLSLPDGMQAACEEVVQLPDADWSTNPTFAIDGAKLDMQLVGKMVQLEDVTIEAVVRNDHTAWDDVLLVGTANALHLEGGLVEPDTDICSVLATHDNDCFECGTGEPTCFTLEIGTQAFLSEIDFDPQIDQAACP
jgi:hypothetical protein